ncbi:MULTISPECIES: multidrug effflux MFS transporter [Mesonia]|uniref:multidrug effflux MFS transporter n=1 Tax=Mesonia TaxID=232115 RepID=UPI000C4FD2B9|nr:MULTISPECIES: multidrug effflux MFS transporter [Mesonia]MAN28841.1 Bcr/CflA family drug resistance efflux transporter [Mesonia sp.]MAQ40412.1 Bcr/CflA family drug resistance efflux transporter [Mesonia sp.]MBJ98033.1 Bcr/CflA family drug resistance efflux transporter [Flavobacteriaceae bacterium]|tara:strand:- start:11486 stop:12712 length:1227 start_codon:yes stop_codon:yes gene_type:complete
MQEDFTIRNKKREKIILLVLGTLIALGPFSIDMYLPSFDSIAKEFTTTKAQVGFSLTSYFIGISFGQLAYGPIMDKFGRKKPLLIGLVVYIVSAISCFYSPNLYWLIISRFFLAIGSSAGMVASKAVVRDIFPPQEVARAISFLMLIMGGAPIIAPTIGGIVITHFSWHIIFLILAVFAVLMFISVTKFLPESIEPDKTVDLKIGQVINKYKGILEDKIFLTFSFAGSLTIGAMFAYISNAPSLFMDKFHLTESQFGWLFGMNAAGLIIGSQLNRLVLKRATTFAVTLIIGFILVALGVLFLINGYLIGNFYTTVILLFFILFLLGFQNPNTTALSLFPFTKRAGRASALVGSLKMIFGAIASFIISKFTGPSLIPLATIILVSLTLSLLLLIRFKAKEKRALVMISR